MNFLETVPTKKLHDSMVNGTPEGWIRCPLKKIAVRITKGATPTSYGFRYQEIGIRFVKIENLKNGRINHESIKHFISEQANLNQSRSILLSGDILFSIAGTIGTTCLVREEDLPANTNQALAIIRGTSDILLPGFLQLQLQSQISNRQASNHARGGSMNNISLEDVGSVEIWVPPLAEQKRIVAKVEELLERVNAAKERLTRVSMIMKRFRQAVLAAACSGRLTADWRATKVDIEPADQLVERIFSKRQQEYTADCKTAKAEGKKPPKKPNNLEPRRVETAGLPEIPDEWSWVYLPDLGYMNRGKSKHRPRNAPHLFGGPYPFIQTGDIAQSGGRITYHRQTYSETGLAQSHLWPSGTVCITIAANIANSAILTYPACFPDSIVGLAPDEALCIKEYVEFFTRTARSNLDQFAPATAQKNINIEILSDVAVPLPPLAEQKEIVHRVEAMFKLAEAVEKRVAAAKARTEKLTQSILAKAFRGELVPTEAEMARREGRSYESASELLARIKSNRESKGAS
jgi:type I restriction enzyme S subunit